MAPEPTEFPCLCSLSGPALECPHHGECNYLGHPTEGGPSCHCGLVNGTEEVTRRVLVTGARDWADEAAIAEALLAARDDLSLSGAGRMLLIHGACPTGADRIADRWARQWGWEVDPHPADWDRYGKAAGPFRNREMVDLGADICLAFIGPNSRGTLDCARRAEVAGIPVVRYYADPAARAALAERFANRDETRRRLIERLAGEEQ